MPLNPEKLQQLMPIVTRHTFRERDTMLYAIGVGAGFDSPLNINELPFIFEDGLQALPTMAAVLGYPGFWQGEERFGLNWQRILHVGQSIEFKSALPVEGAVTGTTTIEDLFDKGEEKGAIIVVRREITDDKSGELLAIVRQTSLLRGDGGFGGSRGKPSQAVEIPDRDCDFVVESETLAGQAHIYRLSGDYNPLHISPEVASRGGFDRPILHGLCSYGVVGRALLGALCDYEVSRFRRLDLRFSSPVFPGEKISTKIWSTGPGTAVFRSTAVERGVTVLDSGFVEYE